MMAVLITTALCTELWCSGVSASLFGCQGQGLGGWGRGCNAAHSGQRGAFFFLVIHALRIVCVRCTALALGATRHVLFQYAQGRFQQVKLFKAEWAMAKTVCSMFGRVLYIANLPLVCGPTMWQEDRCVQRPCCGVCV